jgi:hypothetical protein
MGSIDWTLMAEYNIYPAVDEGYNFPPEIRTSLMQSTDVQAAIDARADTRAQAALTANRQYQNYRWADATARGNQTGMRNRDRGMQLDTGVEYEYDGAKWNVRLNDPSLGVARRYATLQNMINDVANIPEGATVAVGRYDITGTGGNLYHRYSLWQQVNGQLTLISNLVVEASSYTGAKQTLDSIQANIFDVNNTKVFIVPGSFASWANYGHKWEWTANPNLKWTQYRVGRVLTTYQASLGTGEAPIAQLYMASYVHIHLVAPYFDRNYFLFITRSPYDSANAGAISQVAWSQIINNPGYHEVNFYIRNYGLVGYIDNANPGGASPISAHATTTYAGDMSVPNNNDAGVDWS